MSQDTLRQLGQFCNHWLANTPLPNQTLWIFVEDRDTGIDLTRLMAKEVMGDFSSLEIPFDTLPTMPGLNTDNGAAVFVLAQPNHVDTVQVTMQGQLADLRREAIPEEHEEILKHMTGQPELPEEYDHVYTDRELDLAEEAKKNLVRRVPNVMVIHKAEPVWSKIIQFVSSDTDVKMTSAVQTLPPIKPESEENG